MGMPCSSSPSVVCVPISFNWERPQRTPPPGPFGGRWQEPGRWVGYPPWDLNWNHEEGRDQGRSPGGGPGGPLLRGQHRGGSHYGLPSRGPYVPREVSPSWEPP